MSLATLNYLGFGAQPPSSDWGLMVRNLFARPRHPYTRGLLDCSPELGDTTRDLRPIPGRPPSLADTFTGCPFAPRCVWAEPECEIWTPEPVPLEEGGTAACRRLDDLPGVPDLPGLPDEAAAAPPALAKRSTP